MHESDCICITTASLGIAATILIFKQCICARLIVCESAVCVCVSVCVPTYACVKFRKQSHFMRTIARC